MNVVWLREAVGSVRTIYSRIAADNPRAARRVATRIRSSVEQIAEFPHAGRQGLVPGAFELPVPGLRYLVFYRHLGGRIEILRVMPTAGVATTAVGGAARHFRHAHPPAGEAVDREGPHE